MDMIVVLAVDYMIILDVNKISKNFGFENLIKDFSFSNSGNLYFFKIGFLNLKLTFYTQNSMKILTLTTKLCVLMAKEKKNLLTSF